MSVNSKKEEIKRNKVTYTLSITLEEITKTCLA